MDGTTPQASAGLRIARFAAGFAPERLTVHQAALCGRSLADTLAVAFAGRSEHAPLAALRYLRTAGLLQAEGVPLWGRPERAAPEIAAWWNGIAGHVLDYDDVTMPMRGHPSVVLWPALLALAEARTVDAIGLAVAQAAGSRENVGSEAKSFQAGHACAAALRRVLTDPRLAPRLGYLGLEPFAGSPAEAQRLYLSELARWADVVRNENLSPEN